MTRLDSRSIKHRIAYFISPHGFGHAARAAGVMSAIHEIDQSIRFEIFTTVPHWFFQDSLSGPCSYHFLLTDIGLEQRTPLVEDLTKTLQSLDDFLPFRSSQIANLAGEINRLQCELVICDIAPMGIAVAREAGIRSVLVENFTWDWIYQGYTSAEARFKRHAVYLEGLFNAADYHIQTEPVCCPCAADLTTLPISRGFRTPAAEIRKRLEIPADSSMVTITMGGIPAAYNFLRELTEQSDMHFVIPGGSQSMVVRENLRLLPNRSDFFHPDLINASDAVIGKAGYSTIAEVYHAGVPFGYVTRSHFRESEALSDYIKGKLNGIALGEDGFQDGDWIRYLPDLVALPRIQRKGPNGAAHAARFICALLNG